MEAYSSLHLTQVASDRLIALAGVAAEFGSALRSSAPPRYAQYMCGLWSAAIARELQWERADRSSWPFARVPGFPSWSWASQGRIKAGEEGADASRIEAVGVQWHTWWPYRAKDSFTVTTVRRVSSAADQTSGHPRLEERSPLAISLPLSLSGDYGIENQFLALRIQGWLTREFFLRQEWPGGQYELDRAARLTANYLINPGLAEKHQVGRNKTSVLCTDESWHQILHGETLLGWVSFDDTNIRVDNTDSGPCIASDRPRAIFALRLGVVYDVGVDILSNYVDVYALLFVAKCEARIGDECCFERVGVGRMIEDRTFALIEDNFAKQPSTFWLV